MTTSKTITIFIILTKPVSTCGPGHIAKRAHLGRPVAHAGADVHDDITRAYRRGEGEVLVERVRIGRLVPRIDARELRRLVVAGDAGRHRPAGHPLGVVALLADNALEHVDSTEVHFDPTVAAGGQRRGAVVARAPSAVVVVGAQKRAVNGAPRRVLGRVAGVVAADGALRRPRVDDLRRWCKTVRDHLRKVEVITIGTASQVDGHIPSRSNARLGEGTYGR